MMNGRIGPFQKMAGALGLLLVLGGGTGCSGGAPDEMKDGNIDTTPKAAVRVRRSWTSLSPEERKKYIDGVVALKKKTELRWEYTSACEGQQGEYAKNGYDYFVELHLKAFMGMMDMLDTHAHMHEFDAYDRPHMGPHFMPWHREYLLRYEQELRDVLGDPDYMIPYWDWVAPPEQVFSAADMGDMGDCPASPEGDFAEVSGYLAEQGYSANVRDIFGMDPTMLTISCEPKKLTRGHGCNPLAPTLPTADDITQAMSRTRYDAAPYDNLGTEEQESFRQSVEGFTNEDVTEPSGICKFAGCQMHGRVHMWVGGLMGAAAAPNDPIFFLHHANVDRLWAEWQDKHGDDSYPSEAPNDYTGALYSFKDDKGNPVKASEMFDHRALGYVYDTQK